MVVCVCLRLHAKTFLNAMKLAGFYVLYIFPYSPYRCPEIQLAKLHCLTLELPNFLDKADVLRLFNCLLPNILKNQVAGFT